MKNLGILLPGIEACLSITALGVALVACSGAGSPAQTSTAIPAVQPITTVEALVEPPSSVNEVVTLGAELYAANCQVCHGGASGGSMSDIPPPHNANGHTWHHPDYQLVQTILNGSGEMSEMMRRMMGVPEDTPRMPAFRGVLTEDDILAILSYIKTWWTPDQRASQADISRRYQEALEKQTGR